MPSFQLSLPGPDQYHEGVSRGGLLSALRELWNEGNSRRVIGKVNAIIDKLEDRMSKANGTVKSGLKNESFHFVSCPLDPGSWELICVEYDTADTTFAHLEGVLALGHKVSFSFNGQNNLTTCSITDRLETSASFGAVLTGAADGWYDALRVCLWKFTVLLRGDLSNAPVAEADHPRIF